MNKSKDESKKVGNNFKSFLIKSKKKKMSVKKTMLKNKNNLRSPFEPLMRPQDGEKSSLMYL